MLDLKFVRENPDIIAAGLKKRGTAVDLSEFTSLEKKRRELLMTVEELKNRRNRVSEIIAQRKRAG